MSKSANDYMIDKSLFSPEQLAQFEALVAIGKVDKAAEDPEAEHPEKGGNPPAETGKPAKKAEVENMEDAKKSAPEMAPELKAAMDELADLKKSFAMREMVEVAKKYAPLGKNETELAQTLYEMKKSNEANYNAYIAVLDESLGIVEKSGIFAEIGKSAPGGSSANGAVAKAEAKAKEIMKADPTISHTEAIAKAWSDPVLMAEYDAEYFGR